MSIKAKMDIRCDYCAVELEDGDSVACQNCMEELEEENRELKKEIEALKDELAKGGKG
jgi:sugar-specific transcriptional regulator TrmB